MTSTAEIQEKPNQNQANNNTEFDSMPTKPSANQIISDPYWFLNKQSLTCEQWRVNLAAHKFGSIMEYFNGVIEGLPARVPRIGIFGDPNFGKSAFINSLLKSFYGWPEYHEVCKLSCKGLVGTHEFDGPKKLLDRNVSPARVMLELYDTAGFNIADDINTNVSVICSGVLGTLKPGMKMTISGDAPAIDKTIGSTKSWDGVDLAILVVPYDKIQYIDRAISVFSGLNQNNIKSMLVLTYSGDNKSNAYIDKTYGDVPYFCVENFTKHADKSPLIDETTQNLAFLRVIGNIFELLELGVRGKKARTNYLQKSLKIGKNIASSQVGLFIFATLLAFIIFLMLPHIKN